MMSGGNYTTIDDDSQKLSGSVPSVPEPGHTIADTFSGPGRYSTDEPQSDGGWLHKFTVGAYRPFFDVVDRLKESLFPFRGTFTDKTADKIF